MIDGAVSSLNPEAGLLQGKLRLYSWLLFCALAGLCSCAQQINYPVPGVTSLSPTSITAGQPGFTLTVNGSNFTPASTVTWNGQARSTVFQSTSVMTAQILASDVANPGVVVVNVFTPQPGGGTPVTPLQFTIAPVANPVPHITTMSPQGVFAESGQFAIDIVGTNFVSLSNVTVNGNNIPTVFVNSATLQATVPASDVVNSGILQIAVVNPPQNTNPNIPPGGGSSNLVPLNVTNPVPTVGSLTPASVAAGTAATTISVAGSGFVPNAVALVNGSPRTTLVTASGQLTVTLTSSDLASAGVYQIRVTNPAPGGGTSTPLVFAVVPSTVTGLPVLVDVGFDGSPANNGICGGLTNCGNASQGLIPGLVPVVSSGPSVSGTGEFVAFASPSNNLVSGQISTGTQIFLRDTCLSTTTSTTCVPATSLLTGSPSRGAANGASAQPTVDSTGSHVAFTSLATNLVTTPAVAAGASQIYWTPACTSAVTSSANSCNSTVGASTGATLVSESADGLSAGNGNSYDPVISSDGQFVAFVSLATNLVTSDSMIDGSTPQVYVRTLCNPLTSGGATTTSCTPTTYLVSSADGVTPGNGASTQPSIANDGAFVSFTSSATNLGPSAPNPNGKQEIFEQTECFGVTSCTETTSLISTPDAGATAADGASTESTVSDDGRFVAFASTATNLIPGVGPLQEIYLYDTCTGAATTGTTCAPTVKLVSTPDGKSAANALAEYPSINRCGTPGTCATGQFVAFSTRASNLSSAVANGIENVFVRNTCATTVTSTSGATACTPVTAVASHPGGTAPPPSNGDSLVPAISGDGHTVGFLSFSNNLVPNDTNNVEDIFLGLTSF